ncbi:MAG: nuclear transport factor 2 family protein, partial [Acidimicrobiales bacterium]
TDMEGTSMPADQRISIAETVYSYATGIDTRNWPLYRSIFAEQLEIDFSSYRPDQPARNMTADEWVAGVKPLFTGLAATQHTMTNPVVGLQGNEAAITMYMQAHHVYDPADEASWFTIGGYYEDTLVRVDDRWLLTGVKLTVLWRTGDPGIMELARADGMAELDAEG